MKLYDPNRPKIYHKPAFLPDGQCVIPQIHLRPLDANQIEFALMLPLEDNRFSGKYFSIRTFYDQIQDLIQQFTDDPELFVETYFSNDPSGMRPGINPKAAKNSKSEPPKSKISAAQDDVDLLEE